MQCGLMRLDNFSKIIQLWQFCGTDSPSRGPGADCGCGQNKPRFFSTQAVQLTNLNK